MGVRVLRVSVWLPHSAPARSFSCNSNILSIKGVTISTVAVARDHFGGANLFDRSVDSAAFARNVRVVAEALAAFVYGNEKVNLLPFN